MAGGVSDQIGCAHAKLEEVDGPKLSDTAPFIEPEEATEELGRRFTEIYDRGIWGPGGGVGSAPDKTVEYRAFVQQFMARNRVRSVVDLGCGEWQFSQLIDWSGVRYLGVDVVPAMIEKNQRDFGASNIAFETFDLLAKLPRADLLLCKDVLQHLPNKTIKDYLAAFRKKYRFSLITNDEEPAENPEHRHRHRRMANPSLGPRAVPGARRDSPFMVCAVGGWRDHKIHIFALRRFCGAARDHEPPNCSSEPQPYGYDS